MSRREIFSNRSRFSVSSEMLMRRTPMADRSPAYFDSSVPLVVSVSSLQAVAEMAGEAGHQLHDVLPHQRLAAGDAQLVDAEGSKGRDQLVQLLERQHVLARQEGHPLGHAVGAAQVASIGDRQTQIGDAALEGIDQRALPGRQGRGGYCIGGRSAGGTRIYQCVCHLNRRIAL